MFLGQLFCDFHEKLKIIVLASKLGFNDFFFGRHEYVLFVNGRKSDHQLFHEIHVFLGPGGRGRIQSTLYEKTQLLELTRSNIRF